MAIRAGAKTLQAVDENCRLAATDSGTVSVYIVTSATWDGDLSFEASTNGTNFQSVNAFSPAADTLQRLWSTQNVGAQFIMTCSGYALSQVRCTRWVAGFALVTMLAGVGAHGIVLLAPIPAGAQEIGSVRIRPKPGTFTDRSGTITTGGTAQTIAAANTDRRYLLVQNQHASADLYVNFGTAAVIGQPSVLLTPQFGLTLAGSSIETSSVSVIAATTGHPFTAKEML